MIVLQGVWLMFYQKQINNDELKVADQISVSSHIASKKNKYAIMSIEVITREELENFRIRLLKDIGVMIKEQSSLFLEKPEGYKTTDVRKMLGCSSNKIISLRITRKLRTKKIGGTLYYNKEDVKKLLEEGY